MTTIENKFRQLHEDCEVLKKRNGTQKAQKQHETNELHRYCRMVDYYNSLGCSRKNSEKYTREEFKIRS